MMEAIRTWRQQGNIHCWRYDPEKGSLRGWHLRADAPACDGLIGLLGLFKSADYSIHRTLNLSRITGAIASVPFDYRGRRIVSPAAIRLFFDPVSPAETWLLREEGDRLEFGLGHSWLDKLSVSLGEVRAGRGDFSIGPGRDQQSQRLWFWWS